jgi:8-oxo-dGTP pyrophosphatase MutT (NUDIX family)
LNKSTDPGLFDNLIGGVVPDGQTPAQTLLREGWEEAGLAPPPLANAQPGRVIELRRDIPEGLQHEWLHVYDLPMPANVQPFNQDGEVAGFELLPLAQAIELAASERMTVDASLVTLDFVLRHRLLPDALATPLAERCAALWVRGMQ